MLEKAPSLEELNALLGQDRLALFEKLCEAIESRYEMERLWESGGKAWTYGYQYRRGGKTLCVLYVRENCLGLMVIFGAAEREKVEALRPTLSEDTLRTYDEAQTYHDGKWVMFLPEDSARFEEYISLLAVKRRPNRKAADA